MMTMTSWLAIETQAQNKMFAKYKNMDDVEYICITKTMLRLMGGGSVNINGVHIDGITKALNMVVIVNSDNQKVMQVMKDDFAKLSKDEAYETLMEIKNDDERVTMLLNASNQVKEVVMYVDGDDEQVFIVLTGKFTDEQLAKLLAR